MCGWLDHRLFTGRPEGPMLGQGGTNLGLLWKGLCLQWYGIRGTTWESFISTFDKYVKSYPRPDYLIIQAGSNDLGVVKGKVLIENIRADICV
jgi:lysophospholipase L1-like esterase